MGGVGALMGGQPADRAELGREPESGQLSGCPRLGDCSGPRVSFQGMKMF